MNIQRNIDLKSMNTFMLPSIAKYFCEIQQIEDIQNLIQTPQYQNNKKYFLGQGSNTIFTKDFDGLVIKINILGKNISDIGNHFLIKVGAGEIWYDFVNWCADKSLVGMENLAYIPSSVGACAVQNIGAYGAEAKDIIHEVQGFNLKTQKFQILKNSECNFGYRDSIFKHELKDIFIITHVTFKLKKLDKSYQFNCEYAGIIQEIQKMGLNLSQITVKDFVNLITNIRKSKLPERTEIGTAGSFFKNPTIDISLRDRLQTEFPQLQGRITPFGVKLSAGQLIDMCGLKGKSNGKVGTYQTHALILVNEGSATGQDVLDFARHIQNTVKNTFGVQLEPEAIFVN